MSTTTTYTRRVGALTLTIEPLVTAGHGRHERTYVARVDVDVPEYRTTANVARKHIGARTPMRAYAKAFNVGHRLMVHSLIAGIGADR